MAKVLLEIEIDAQGNVTAIGRAEDALKGLDKSGKKAAAQLEKVRRAQDKLANGAIIAGGAIVGASALAVREGLALGKGMAEVSTLVDTATVSMDQLERGVRSLGTETGESVHVLTKGLYQTISAGVDAADAIEFLGTASKAAVGGVTDTATAVDGMTTVMNAWGKSAEDATDIADSMFMAVKAGKTTFGELSSAYAYVAATASAAGLSIDETNAALAAMTTQGLRTNMAARGLNMALVSMTKPTDDQRKLAASLGIELSETALKEKGLVGVMAELEKATGGSVEQMGKLLGSSDAAKAGLALVGSGGEKFNATLGMMENKAGAASEAYDKMAGSGAQAMARMKASVTEVGLSIAETLEPIVTSAADALKPLLDGFAWFVRTPLGKPFIVAGAGLAVLALGAGLAHHAVRTVSDTVAAARIVLAYFKGSLGAETAALDINTAAHQRNRAARWAVIALAAYAGYDWYKQARAAKEAAEEQGIGAGAAKWGMMGLKALPVIGGMVHAGERGYAEYQKRWGAEAADELEKVGKAAAQASDELAGHSLTTAAEEATEYLVSFGMAVDWAGEQVVKAASGKSVKQRLMENYFGEAGYEMGFGEGGMFAGGAASPSEGERGARRTRPGQVWEPAAMGLPGFWRTGPAEYIGGGAAGPGGGPERMVVEHRHTASNRLASELAQSPEVRQQVNELIERALRP